MIVELTGPPASGKTTLLPMITAFFQDLGLGAFPAVEAARPCASRTLPGAAITQLSPPVFHRRLLWQVHHSLGMVYRLKFMAKHPQLTWKLVASQRQRLPSAGDHRFQVAHWFFHHVGNYEFFKAYARPDEVIIFEEGFTHRIVQLFSANADVPDAHQMAIYPDGIPKPDLLVAIKASQETCEQRIYNRQGVDVLCKQTAGEISEAMRKAHLAVSLALEQAREKGWRVVEVDNDTDDLLATRLTMQRQIALALPVGETGIYLGTT